MTSHSDKFDWTFWSRIGDEDDKPMEWNEALDHRSWQLPIVRPSNGASQTITHTERSRAGPGNIRSIYRERL